MRRLLIRLAGLLAGLAIFLGLAGVLIVVGVQTPGGADMAASWLRRAGLPLDSFRVERIGLRRLVVTDVVLDGGLARIDRLDVTPEDNWLQLAERQVMGGATAAGQVAGIDAIIADGLYLKAEFGPDGELVLPVLGSLRDLLAQTDDRPDAGDDWLSPVTVHHLQLDNAIFEIAAPGALMTLRTAATGSLSGQSATFATDGRLTLSLPFGFAIDGLLDTRLLLDGANGVGLTAQSSDLVLTRRMTTDEVSDAGDARSALLTGGSIRLDTDLTAGGHLKSLSGRFEAEHDLDAGDAGDAEDAESAGRIAGRLSVGVTAASGGWLSSQIETFGPRLSNDDADADLTASLALDLSADRFVIAALLDPVLGNVLAPLGQENAGGLPQRDGPRMDHLMASVDGLVADAAALSELMLAVGAPWPEDIGRMLQTAAAKADLAIDPFVVLAMPLSEFGEDTNPSTLVAAIGEAVIEGLIGLDIGINSSGADGVGEGEGEDITVRGAVRVSGAAESLHVSVEEALTGVLGTGALFHQPNSTSLSLLPGTTLTASSEAANTSEGGVRFDGFLRPQFNVAGVSMATIDQPIVMGLRLPDRMAGPGDIAYRLSAPSVGIDNVMRLFGGAGDGLDGLTIGQMDLALAAHGTFAHHDMQVDLSGGVSADRDDVAGNAEFSGSAVMMADTASGIGSITQDGCLAVTISDAEIPGVMRLAAPLQVCLTVDGEIGVSTTAPHLDPLPRGVTLSAIDVVLLGSDTNQRVFGFSSPGISITGLDDAVTFSLAGASITPGEPLGSFDDVSVDGRLVPGGVEADFSAGWSIAVLGSRQRYGVTGNLSTLDGGAGRARLTGAGRMPGIDVSVNRDPDTGRIVGDWTLDRLTTARFLDIAESVPAIDVIAVSEPEGQISASGQVIWDDGLRASGRLGLSDVGFATPFFRMAGVNTTLRADSLFPLSVPRGQRVSIETVDLGFLLENGGVSVGMRGDTVTLEDIRFLWAGGTVSAQPISTRLSDRERTIVLIVENLRLADLFAEAPLEDFEITGTVSGRIPLRLTSDTVFIDGGILTSDGPGRMVYRSEAGGQAAEADGGGLNILFQALENFRYRQLTVTLDGQTGYDLELGIIVEGANPDLYDGYPVRLNVGISGALDDILRSGLETSRIGRQAEDIFRLEGGNMTEEELQRRLLELER